MSFRSPKSSIAIAMIAAAGVALIAASNALAAGAIHFSNASSKSKACKAKDLEHIYITVTQVRAHQSGKGSAGWHTLAQPDTPVQLDLLDEGVPEDSDDPSEHTVSDCLLASLGENDGLPPGKYQQIRVLTADSGSAAPDENACSSLGDDVFNCVQLNDNSFHALDIPSGSQTGLKIPSTKIQKGGLRITPDQGLDLDIDIDGCKSVVVTGGGHGRGKKKSGSAGYKMKPVLQAHEVSLNAIISGQALEGTVSGDNVTAGSTPVPNATVWLEDTSAPGVTEGNPGPGATTVPVNAVIAETTTDSNGNFVFCPAPAGSNLEIVASAPTMPSGSNPSDVTITTGITVDSHTGGPVGLQIPMVEPSAAPTADAKFTTQSNSSIAISEILNLGMTQSDGTNQAPFDFANADDVSPTTTGSSGGGCSCPANTDCSCVSLAIPPDNPVIGAAGGSYSQTSGDGSYSVLAGTSTTTGAGSCSPASLITPSNASSSALPQPTLSFQGCQ
jgi:hypothetical protein